MRIRNVRTVLLTGPNTNDPYLGRSRRSAAFVEIVTDTELVGLGETYAGYFCPEVVPPIVDFFRPVLEGRDLEVDTIPMLRERIRIPARYWARVGLGAAVLTAIDAALWDLAGKMAGVPVYKLLGGLTHRALIVYATGGSSIHPLEKLIDKIDFYLSLGFNAVKFGTGAMTQSGDVIAHSDAERASDYEAEKLAFVRSHVGPGIRLLLDGHQNNRAAPWDLATALAVSRAIVPFDVFFFEEPLPYSAVRDYARLRNSRLVPIAGGEVLAGLDEWRAYASADSFDIAQPDASFVGGLGDFMEVARRFEMNGRKVATHAWGAGGSLMQNLHCAFATPNIAICEFPPAYGPLHSEVIGDSLAMHDGVVMPPEAPGLGIRLSSATRERYPFVPGSGEHVPVPGKRLVDLGFALASSSDDAQNLTRGAATE